MSIQRHNEILTQYIPALVSSLLFLGCSVAHAFKLEIQVHYSTLGPGSVVGIATAYRPDDPGIEC